MTAKVHRITNGQRAAVCGLIIAGLSFRDACAVADASQQRIHDVLPPGWFEGPPPSRRYKSWKGQTLEAIRVAYVDRQMSGDEIEALFGISKTYLYRLVSRKNWPRRKYSSRLPPMTADQRRVYDYLRGNGITRQSAITEAFR